VNMKDLAMRIRRLDELSRGLAKEISLWKECNDPLLYQERRGYLRSIQRALEASESARVILVEVRLRLEKEKAGETSNSA